VSTPANQQTDGSSPAGTNQVISSDDNSAPGGNNNPAMEETSGDNQPAGTGEQQPVEQTNTQEGTQ